MGESMQYEETANRNSVSEAAVKKLHKQAITRTLDNISTSGLLWHLVKRHKFALMTTYAVIVTVCHIAPFVPDALFGLVRG